MQDILILLQHLADNEETTIKLIIECLYDVGAVNFINRKVQNPAVNQLTKTLASLSKPLAKRYGLYWFKKNCPELIVNWLQRKVAFPPPQMAPSPKTEVEAQPNIIKAVEVAETQAQAEGPQPTVASSPSAATTEVSRLPSSTGIEAETMETQTTPAALETAPNSPSLDTAEEGVETTMPAPEAPDTQLEPVSAASTPLPAIDPAAQKTIKVNEHQVLVDTSQLELKILQIRRLKRQIRVLTGTLLGTTLMSGFVIWHLHTTQQNALQAQPSTPSSIGPVGQPVE